jgi:hypothetical protein
MLPENASYLRALLRSHTSGLLVFVLLFCIPVVNGGEDERNVEEITGLAVAYDDVIHTLCIDICDASLIIRIDVANEAKPRFIRVDLKFRPKKFPKELIMGKKRWRFKLTRTASLDGDFDEFILGKSAAGKEFKIPRWALIPGAEDEKLPFGETLHSYSLVKNGFKLVPN